METQRDEIGMIGLGVMGRNLLLNMADHGFSVAGYDKDPGQVEALRKESAGNATSTARPNIKEFIGLLRRPRAVMMLVPAGPPVDSVIEDLLPHLEKGDLIIDAGNSYFKDTNLRARNLAANRHSIPRRGRVGRRGGRAPRPEHHARRDRKRPTSASARCLKPSRPRSTASRAWPSSAPDRPAISSRWSTTASNTR